MDHEELIRKISDFGFVLYVGPDGIVHGKARVHGQTVPAEMRPLLEELRSENDAVADMLRLEQDTVELKGLTRIQAEPWLRRVQAGLYRLVGQAVYHRSTNTADFKLEKVVR